MSPNLKKKYSRFTDILIALKKVLIAFSGGADSTFLLDRSISILGHNNIMAVIAVSETYPLDELKLAEKFCKHNKINYKVIRTNELKISKFIKNPPERCYYCKKELFTKLKKITKKYKFDYIIDGTNIDDFKDFRPGLKAKKELGIISPLAMAKLTKQDIRELSKKFKINTFNKPSLACLSSRFPYGSEITIEKINMVGKAESFLKKLGLITLRVRHHKNIARIESNPSNFNKILLNKNTILKYFKKIGYKYITLDIEGFRSGSMNEVL